MSGVRAAPANSTATSTGPVRSATARTTSSEALSPLTYTVGRPSPDRTKPVTGPVRWVVPSGPCWAGTAVTVTGPTAVASQVGSARAVPPSRCAASSVVSTTGTPASSLRPASSRLSGCWSCESSTASTLPRSSAATAGPLVLVSTRSPIGWSPGGSKVGSVSSRTPPSSISAVGPPTSRTVSSAVMRRYCPSEPAGHARVRPAAVALERDLEHRGEQPREAERQRHRHGQRDQEQRQPARDQVVPGQRAADRDHDRHVHEVEAVGEPAEPPDRAGVQQPDQRRRPAGGDP